MIKSYLADRTNSNEPFFDEMTTPDGKVWPHWEKLASAYEKLGIERMEQRNKEVGQQLRENGVTYNVYGDPNGMNRPWNLDPVPMVFSQNEWEVIEKGLSQRTELLNIILSDIYGERKLIREGLIPFEMIYNHQGFLRQADKIRIPGPQQLVQYSADLARGPNGKMWVLHDRTDAPSGAGYSLENRAAMTRVFPDMIRENQVRKVSSYYQTLKNTLSTLSWKNKENPRIVMLSPGPSNETFFEHAYLSSFMGFTLVFAQDLTMSDGYIWLKTLKGLEKVDVIVRRVDDVFCDPLEFRADSHLGVVGLMEAVRQKNVMVINPLGCRILENPGLMAFLPKLSRHVLQQELILPSVATWWCGQEKEKKYVLENIEKLIIRTIYRNDKNKSVYGGELSKKEIEELKEEIKVRPYLFVGQEMVDFSTTPSLIDGKLEARNAVFRSYVVADSENETYYVMPGGLSRSSPKKGVFIVSNQSGGISKDTWVLGHAKEQVQVNRPPVIVQQTENILPSRTGENLFWLGRYLERTVSTIRLMRIVLRKFNETDDEVNIEHDQTLVTLLKGLTSLTSTQPGFHDKRVLKDPEKELYSLAIDQNRFGSLAHSLKAFLSNGYAIRDRLSLDTWRILDLISEEWEIMKMNGTNLRGIYHRLDHLIVHMMAFNGLNIDNMTRESTWRLLNIGRFIESSIGTCLMLQATLSGKSTSDQEKSLIELILMSNESLVTYRYRYRSNLEVLGVLNLLLADDRNPRAIVYMIERIDDHLKQLPSLGIGTGLSPARKKLLEALSKVRLVDLNELAELKPDTDIRKELKQFLGDIVQLLQQASTLIYESYFSHTQSQYGFVKANRLPEI
ncbi:MAG: circularly permuted type 2 ATP-grasp protein [Imperialibacter sp.]|uniref:circularly permuted type 2 ATP-grasp protein n=1 Tax=Imperialibacter sp. TaxID=2038411 RepID=UPI0032EC2CC7